MGLDITAYKGVELVDTLPDADEFAREFMHRAFVGRGAKVDRADLQAENERLRAA